MPADLTPLEAVPQLGPDAQALYELLAERTTQGIERALDPLTQLVQLLAAPRQTQVRGSDQFVAGNSVWIVPSTPSVPDVTTQLSRVLTIPAQLNRVRLTIKASAVWTIIGQTLGYAGALFLSDRPFTAPGVIPTASVGPSWYLDQQGYALTPHALSAASAVEPTGTLELPTRREVYIRPVCYAQANTTYFARVDWIAHLQVPQPVEPADDGRPCDDC